MSRPLFGSLLLEGAVLSEREKTIIADTEAVCKLNLFSDNDSSYVQDFDTNHFYKWCVEVLAADFWDVFNSRENDRAKHLVRLLKYHFCQPLAQLLVIEGDQ